MPIYMDLHIVPGVTARDVAEAHVQDVKIQDRYCCRAMTYWYDEDRGSVFCLIEAPDKESVSKMHEHSHGLIPNEIIEVNNDVVCAFLGRINDPEFATFSDDSGLRIFNDPAFRILLVVRSKDTRLLQHQLGSEKSHELMVLHNSIVREQLKTYGGREADRQEEGFVISFVSVARAVECAVSIQQRLHVAADLIGLRIGIHGGVPVNPNHREMFGSTLNLAKYLCAIGKDAHITMSATVRGLYKEIELRDAGSVNRFRWLSPSEESFLNSLISVLEENWQDPAFGVNDFSRLMSISKPQLYRKCTAVAGASPNNVLRDYRLNRSLDLLRNDERNISQTTFDSGFSSPSYFTKCFQKRFGMQPLAYQKTGS